MPDALDSRPPSWLMRLVAWKSSVIILIITKGLSFAAIDLGVGLALSSARGTACTVQALDIPEEICFDLPVTAPVKQPLWVNYVRGVVNKLGALGRIEPGFQATFAGDIPMGAGLSSSAALEIAAALALSRLYGITVAPLELAKIGQAAENDFAGAHCGLLDQISSLFGQDHAMVFSDFRTLAVKTVPLVADICFLLVDTLSSTACQAPPTRRARYVPARWHRSTTNAGHNANRQPLFLPRCSIIRSRPCVMSRLMNIMRLPNA